jgi:hypothetical protein
VGCRDQRDPVQLRWLPGPIATKPQKAGFSAARHIFRDSVIGAN